MFQYAVGRRFSTVTFAKNTFDKKQKISGYPWLRNVFTLVFLMLNLILL